MLYVFICSVLCAAHVGLRGVKRVCLGVYGPACCVRSGVPVSPHSDAFLKSSGKRQTHELTLKSRMTVSITFKADKNVEKWTPTSEGVTGNPPIMPRSAFR